MTWQLEQLQIPADLTAEPEASQRLRTWMDVTARAFLMERCSDAAFEWWWRSMAADGHRAGQVTDDGQVVATWCDFPWQLDLGAGATPFWAITDVSVRPTHRRRGILRNLMHQRLEHARQVGMPMAGLTVSEGSIYGRFGFGIAASSWKVEIDADTFTLRQPDDGTIDLVEPAELGDHVAALASCTRQAWPGVHPMESQRVATVAAWDFGTNTKPTNRYAAVHRTAEGTVDGAIVWTFERANPAPHILEVDQLWGTPRAVLALIEWCTRIDLIGQVRVRPAPPVGQLQAAVTDPRSVTVSGYRDGVWLRPLELSACVAARPWAADGSFTLQVDDPMGHVDGTWAVTVADGKARAESASDQSDQYPDLRLDVEALGSLLGQADLRDLVAVRRAQVNRDLAELMAIVGVNPAPWHNVFF